MLYNQFYNSVLKIITHQAGYIVSRTQFQGGSWLYSNAKDGSSLKFLLLWYALCIFSYDQLACFAEMKITFRVDVRSYVHIKLTYQDD